MRLPADSEPARAWTFDELVHEGVAAIPARAPAWTNHNLSDPGITILELLAYFAEILVYRALRVTPDAKLYLLRLLEGKAPTEQDILLRKPSRLIDDAIRARGAAMSQAQCAVTLDDFTLLAVEAARDHLATHAGSETVRHAQVGATCAAGVDPRHGLGADEPGDIVVALAADVTLSAQAADALCQHVHKALAPRCLLTTRVHVIPARHLHVFVGCRVTLAPEVDRERVIERIDAALRRRFDPMQVNDPPTDAWPFGRPVRLTTIAAVIDNTDGVDHVDDIIVVRMSLDGQVSAENSWVGVRVGLGTGLGIDTWLGGMASISSHRLQTDQTGEAETVIVLPWEIGHVRLDTEFVRVTRRGDASAMEAGRG